jgi:NodT family efflux transporter outer membrane factor (OMF) lipoprotein
MEAIKISIPSACRYIVHVTLAVSLLVAAGCAHIPRLDPSPTIKNVEQVAAADAFAAAAAEWPGDVWWRAYADPQLDALIEEALRGAPDLALAQARLDAAAAAVRFASATRIPEITGSAALTEEKQSYNSLIPRQALPHGWTDYGLVSLDFSWELDFWGKNRSALAAAVSDQKAATFEYAETRLLLSTSVAAAYAGLVDLYTVRDNAAETLRLREETVALFRRRHDFGLETLASVRQVEARRASAEAELRSYDERIGLQGNAIAALLGAGPDRGLAIARPSARFTASTGLPPNLASDLLGRRPDILAARSRADAAAHRIDEKKAGFYPSVNLIAMVGVQSLGIRNLMSAGSEVGSAGPAVSLPIFNTRRLQGALRGARAEYDASVATYNATLSQALREVADAATSRKALDGELKAARAAVAAAAEAHQLVRTRYEGALATYLDVLEAQDELISAQRAQAALETRALILDVSLVRALGGGFAPDRPTT